MSLFSQSLFPLLRFMVSFPTDEQFSPVGRWFSRNSGCQDVAVLLKYGCGVRFGFLLLFLRCVVTVLLCNHWRFSGRVCSVVGASVFATTISRCGARHFHRCNLPDHIPSSSRSLRSFLRFILADPLCITFSPTLSLNMESLSYTQKRGE